MLNDDGLLAALEQDYEQAGLDQRRLAMLRYVDKLTRCPQSMTRRDFDQLMAAGFSDSDVLHIVEVAAYYAYVNRIADGLGVELESPAPGSGD